MAPAPSSPLAGRLGVSPATAAVAFALLEPSVASVLFGATRPAQVAENVAALELVARLTPAEAAALASPSAPDRLGDPRRHPVGPARDLQPGEPQDDPAGTDELSVAPAVGLERRSRSVVPPSIDLDDQPHVDVGEVDAVAEARTAHVVLEARQRQPGAADEARHRRLQHAVGRALAEIPPLEHGPQHARAGPATAAVPDEPGAHGGGRDDARDEELLVDALDHLEGCDASQFEERPDRRRGIDAAASDGPRLPPVDRAVDGDAVTARARPAGRR